MKPVRKLMQLKKTGPYKQAETPGFFGLKSYSVPKENPVDGSFMPACDKGPCGKWSERWIESEQRTDYHCDYYLDPNRVPQKTDWFADSPEKDRRSCSYAIPDNGLHVLGQKVGGEDNNKYWVFWDEDPDAKPQALNTTKKNKKNTNAPLVETVRPKGLDKTGPYPKNETQGYFGTSYSMPDKNPVDGSYMPLCGKGRCISTSQYRDGGQLGETSCNETVDPDTTPPNPKDPKGPKVTSCAIPDDNSLYGGKNYYVYWDKLPEHLQDKKVPSDRITKKSGPYEIQPQPFMFGSTVAQIPSINPIDGTEMIGCHDTCAAEYWHHEPVHGSRHGEKTKVRTCYRHHERPYKLSVKDDEKHPKGCSKGINFNGAVMNPDGPVYYDIYWNEDPTKLILANKPNNTVSNKNGKVSRIATKTRKQRKQRK